jgi:Protein of unknown function (DUF551)
MNNDKPIHEEFDEAMKNVNISNINIGEWISVKDRLPNNNDDVLVFHDRDFHITIGEFEKDNVSYYIESDGRKFYTHDGWSSEIPWAPKGKITHWMPIQPPMDNE